jgi:hypothetical protein
MLRMAGEVVRQQHKRIAAARSADGVAILLIRVVVGARALRALVAGEAVAAVVVVDGAAEAAVVAEDDSEHVSRTAIQESHSLEDQACFF